MGYVWVGYSELINGLIAIATSALVCWRTSLLLACYQDNRDFKIQRREGNGDENVA